LLESTATDEIARQAGYQDPALFRRLFKRSTGVTPARYRQRFRRIAQTGDEPGATLGTGATR